MYISPAICLGKYNQKSFICINVQLKYTRGNTKEKILINSGVEELLINKQFCYDNMIKLERIAEPIPVFTIDGFPNYARVIIAKAHLLMRMNNLDRDYYDKQCKLLTINLGGEDAILGTDWLYKHNPQID